MVDIFKNRGIAARHFGKETRLGSQLDTIADFVFAAVVIMKVARTVSVPEWLMIWIISIAIIKIINVISGFVVVKRFVSEHTAMNKVCGIQEGFLIRSGKEVK